MTSYNDFNADGKVADFSNTVTKVGNTIESKCQEQTLLYSGVESIIEAYKDAIVVGDKNFVDMTGTFQDDLEQTLKDINTYFDDALDISEKIKKYIETDIEAKEAAEAAYTDFMTNKKGDYESEGYDKDKKQNVIIYNEEEHKKDALEEAEKVWRRENCELWND